MPIAGFGVQHMVWQSNSYVYLMALAGAISLAVAGLTWRRRPAPGSAPLAIVNLAGAIWAWASSLELASGTLGYAIIFHKLSFLGMVTIGPALFAFAAEYTGHDRWVTTKQLAALALLPATTQVLIWTSGHHAFFWRALAVDASGLFVVLDKTPGVWWWIDSAYTYGLIGITVFILGATFVREPRLYRRQISAILAAIFVPVAADFMYIDGLAGSESVNLTPALFAWVGLALYWGFTRYRLLDVGPLAP